MRENRAVMTQHSTNRANAVSADAALLGERVRSLRAQHNLTIAELAERAGLSSGLISQIERGRSNPSVRTLQLLRSALGVNMWEFLQPRAHQGSVGDVEAAATKFIRRKTERQTLVVGRTRLVKELLSPRADENLRFMIVTLPPGGESEDALQSQGQKGGYMLSGRMRLTVGDETGDLDSGDSFQFRADVPHKIFNPYDEEAQVIWIMSMVDAHL
jgi:transcriptional regulator with XRE-family HTH domain